MLALSIFLLIAWVAWLTIRQNELSDRLGKLERRASAPEPEQRTVEDRLESEGVIPARAAAPQTLQKPAPLPVPAPPEAETVTEAAFTRQPEPERPARTGPEPREQIAAWLSENGLAWMGGAVLALGGLFLVAYAAQRGFFTPAMRIAGAIAVGFVLVAVSEWLKRQADREAGGHRLAAAAAAGAGAATLYAAAWASYWLYDFIAIGAAGGFLGLISLGLLALSVRHGEPLAILAVGGALMAPAMTGPQHWDAPALTGYLALVVVIGYATAGARRWGQAGLTTLVGAALWAGAGFAAEGYVRVAALAVGPVALSIAALEWRRRRAPDEDAALTGSFTLMPTLAIGVAALLMAGLWLVRLHGYELAAATVGSGVLLALAAYAVLRRLAPSILQLGVYASAALVVVSFPAATLNPELEIWSGVLALAAAACGLWAALGGRNERERLYAGGGALAALIIALAMKGPLTLQASWAPPGLAALVLGACGSLLARRTAEPATSLPLAIWIWTGGSALLVALKLASDPQALAVVVAVAAAGFAVLHVRIGWRGFGSAAVASGLASFGALLTPDLLRPLFAGHGSPIALAAAAGISAAVVFGASRMVHDKEKASPISDALATAALLIALTGAFILLRFWGDKGTGTWRLDPFFESSLRTVLGLTAGLLSTLAVRESSHPIGRWRGHVLLMLGLIQALVLQVLVLNPLWAFWVPAVSGPPLIDSLALGFLAPALLLGAAASRRVTRDRRLVAVYAAAALGFAVLWAVLEIRRLFQGASLHLGIDPIGRAEVVSYALLGLLIARGLFAAAGRSAGSLGEISGPIRAVARVWAWFALAFAVLAYGYLASPWWGPITRPLDSQATAALLLGVYATGAATTLWLIRAAQAREEVLLSRASRIAAVIVVFALLNVLTRWAFRGLDMGPNNDEASLQTWTFSAVWGLYGFGLLVFAAARREPDLRWAGLAVLIGTTAKVFIFDMAHLEGVVRAGSFLAVGALLLAAAVIVRRLSGGALGLGRAKTAGEPD
jgi:uncharacterized membrane protein